MSLASAKIYVGSNDIIQVGVIYNEIRILITYVWEVHFVKTLKPEYGDASM